MNRLKLLIAAMAMISLAHTAAAKSPINTTLFGGLAVKGYDPVHYFTANHPAKGSRQFQYTYMDANWRFVSRENLELFKQNPEKYMPQYGGYCAWAVSQGDTAGIDPTAWKIVNGKLYLNYNRDIQKKWESDQGALIRQADKNWPAVLE